MLFRSAFVWDAEAVARLWRDLRQNLPAFDLAILEKMPAEIGGAPNPLMLLDPVANPVSGHAARLSGTWDDFAKTRLPRRQDSRRKLRKLEKLGSVAFSMARTPDEVEAYLEAMIRQKARRFAETWSDGFAAPGKLAYFRAAAHRLGLSGPVRLFAMTVGDTIVATHWGMVALGRFYHMMPGYDGGPWRALSAGKFLNEHLIEWSFGQGLETFDFGIGDEVYKSEYCDLLMPLHRVVRPVTIRGRAFVGLSAVRDLLRRTALWQRVRWVKWRLVRRSPPAEEPGSA